MRTVLDWARVVAPLVWMGCASYGAPSLGTLRAEVARATPSEETRRHDEETVAAGTLDRRAFVRAVLDLKRVARRDA